MYDSNLYRRPHVMQWPLLKTPNFWVSSAEYYIGLLSLGRGHNVARLDTRAPGSLRHAARLETSWPGQWLCYLAAVVSICEYTYLIKGACRVTVMTVGATSPTAPLVPPPMGLVHGLLTDSREWKTLVVECQLNSEFNLTTLSSRSIFYLECFRSLNLMDIYAVLQVILFCIVA